MTPTIVFVVFTATWCGPCQQLHGDFAGHPLMTFVDVDQQPGLARQHNVRNFPTTIAMIDGKEVGRKVGYEGKKDMERWMSAMEKDLPDSKIPWWDNEYEGTYSEDRDEGYPYDMGTKVQE